MLISTQTLHFYPNSIKILKRFPSKNITIQTNVYSFLNNPQITTQSLGHLDLSKKLKVVFQQPLATSIMDSVFELLVIQKFKCKIYSNGKLYKTNCKQINILGVIGCVFIFLAIFVQIGLSKYVQGLERKISYQRSILNEGDGITSGKSDREAMFNTFSKVSRLPFILGQFRFDGSAAVKKNNIHIVGYLKSKNRTSFEYEMKRNFSNINDLTYEKKGVFLKCVWGLDLGCS